MLSLKEMRIKKGVSQETVAKYLGVARSNYSYIERGERNGNIKLFYRLSKYFEVSLDDIFLAFNETKSNVNETREGDSS